MSDSVARRLARAAREAGMTVCASCGELMADGLPSLRLCTDCQDELQGCACSDGQGCALCVRPDADGDDEAYARDMDRLDADARRRA